MRLRDLNLSRKCPENIGKNILKLRNWSSFAQAFQVALEEVG
jgi:hypothetical protein